MITDPGQAAIIAEATRLLHAERLKEAALSVIDGLELDAKIESDNPAVCYPPLQMLLQWCLMNDGLEEAAGMLWPKAMFNPEPKCSRDVWHLFDECPFGLIMGAASMSKSFTMGVRLFLEWLRDPMWTTVKVIGPSEDHLQQNLFSHLVSMHQHAKLPMPGEVGDLFIGLDRRNKLSSISGVIIPIGRTKKAGRLQGGKRKPRPAPHPVFGELSRMFIFIDEIENVPSGVWSDIDNVMSNFTEDDKDGLKIFGAYNPTNQTDEVGRRAEPPFGWGSFDVNSHHRWTSLRGWEVLRLDGEQSENVIAGRVIYPGLQNKEGLEKIARNSGGRESPGYFSMGRGAYPPTGATLTVIPPGMLGRIRGEPIWLDSPKPAGSCDLALEGAATAVFTLGRIGQAVGVKFPPSLDHPTGHTQMFKNAMGQTVPRWVAVADQQFPLAKGDTVKQAAAIINLCRKAGVKPELFCMDRTGNGAGVADLIKNDWSSAIHDVNYSESATDARIMAEDTQTCKEAYERIATEVWFALRGWMEFGHFFINPQMPLEIISQQLTQRRFRSQGKQSRVESKKDYIGRGYTSPDEADSLTLFVHGIRCGMKLVLSMTDEAASGIQNDDDDQWYDGGGVRVDPSNVTDTLDEREHSSPIA